MTSGAELPAAGRLVEQPDSLVTRGVSLAVLMGDLRARDVSSLSGVSQSTVSRLWGNPQWIERVEGATLSKLMAISPAVGDYVRKWGERQRLDVAVQFAKEAGIHLRPHMLADLARTAPASTAIAALSAVTEMVQGRYDNASRLFATSWGHRTNSVVDGYFARGSVAVFENLDTVLSAAEAFVYSPPAFSELNQIVGFGIVEHKLIKNGVVQPRSTGDDTRSGLTFLTRSSTIARILADDDMAFVDRYRERVFAHSDLMVMELWSHATYAHDLPIRRKRLPSTTSLRSTAAMTAADIRDRNDAYVYYLLVVAIPLLTKLDPRLVERYPSVALALEAAVEQRTDKRIRAAAHELRVTHDLDARRRPL